MPKKSPAPWHVRATSKLARGYSNVADDNGVIVATTHGPNHAGNARLIAIAPEMYAAIEHVLSLRKPGDGQGLIPALNGRTAKQLRALLSRAE